MDLITETTPILTNNVSESLNYNFQSKFQSGHINKTALKPFFYERRNDYRVFKNSLCSKRNINTLYRLKVRQYIAQQLRYSLPTQMI